MDTTERTATLFDLDAAELDLLARIEALFQEPMDETLDPGAESERLVDEYLAQLEGVQEQLGAKLIGYVKAIKAKTARASLLEAEARLYAVEANRLADKAKAEVDTAEFLQGRLKVFMDRRGLTEFEAGTYKLKIVNQVGRLPLRISNDFKPEQVDSAYRKEIPARFEFDRQAIEAALKAGQKLLIELPKPENLGEGEVGITHVDWAWFDDRPTKLKIS